MSYPYSIFQQPYIEGMKNRPGKTERLRFSAALSDSLALRWLCLLKVSASQRKIPNGFLLSNESSANQKIMFILG